MGGGVNCCGFLRRRNVDDAILDEESELVSYGGAHQSLGSVADDICSEFMIKDTGVYGRCWCLYENTLSPWSAFFVFAPPLSGPHARPTDCGDSLGYWPLFDVRCRDLQGHIGSSDR